MLHRPPIRLVRLSVTVEVEREKPVPVPQVQKAVPTPSTDPFLADELPLDRRVIVGEITRGEALRLYRVQLDRDADETFRRDMLKAGVEV